LSFTSKVIAAIRQESSRANRTNPKAIIVVDIRSEKDILPACRFASRIDLPLVTFSDLNPLLR